MSERQRQIKVFRDGQVHVMRRQCATCIFFPDNRMLLEPGRVDQMIADCVERDTIIPCHERMDTKTPAVCRGLFNEREKRAPVAALQIAARLGLVAFDE